AGNGQFVRAELPANEVVQDFRGGAWNAAESFVLHHFEVIAQRETRFQDAVVDFHRRKRVDMHSGKGAFDGPQQVAVEISVKVARQAALNADFRGTAIPRLTRTTYAYSLSFEEVIRRAREAWDCGASEVCIQGGLPRDLDGYFYRDLLRAIKRSLPAMHVHAFSPMEIDYGVLKTGLPLRDYLKMMKDEGLGSIPGT